MIKHTVDKKFEFVYLLDVPCVYASVIEPKKKYSAPAPDAKNQSTREYSVTVFVDKSDREKLEDELMLNKQFFEVGKDKTKKRKIKFPVVDDEGKETAYTPYKGLHGVTFTLNELKNDGSPYKLAVVDSEGNPFEELVGNGSTISIKLFGWRNSEDMLNVSLNTVVIKEHIPYEGGSGGVVTDDILGVTIDTRATAKSKAIKDEFAGDDEPPFEADDNDDDF